MTRINRITIHGFKSFANKTEIPFEDKFNCILGPNGSGKSNIGDALCFVLGRLSTKSMRVEKASNLIFNGGKNKKPSSHAYVEIAFDNSNKLFPHESEEIVINRSVSQDGNSVYRLNGKKHTRTEILEMLGKAKINPNGYNIILQGDIMHFVDMPPMERRKVIEEISDVSVYEEKKHKATLELNKVEEQLNNADIILKERQVHLKELKKDRDQALKFKELKDKINSNKATYLNYQIKEKAEVKAKFDAEISKHQEKINKSEESTNKLKQEVVVRKEEVAKINQEIEQKGEKEQLKVHRSIENLKVDLAKQKARVSTLKDEINKIQQRKDQFNIEIKDLEEKSSSHSNEQKELQNRLNMRKKELEQTEQNISQFKKKNKIESSRELDEEIEQKDKIIDQKQEHIQQVRQKQQELLRDKDRLEYQLQTMDERIAKVKEVEQQNKEQVKQLQKHKQNFKEATLRLNKLLDQDSSFASQLANARKKQEDFHDKEAKLNASTMTAQANLAGNHAVKAILDNKREFHGVHGTVAELGQATKKYSQALEKAAGTKMQHLVVDDDKIAAECIKYLQNNKLGAASFIPLNKIKYNPITAEDKKNLKLPGVHDFAINLIKFSPRFEKAFANVFGNTIIVDDIDTARKVGIGTIKMATLDGNIAEASGIMKGGFFNKKSVISFQEKDSLEELEKIQAEISEIDSVIMNVQEKRSANEQEINGLRNSKAEIEAEIIKLEKTLHLDNSDLEATASLKKEVSSQLAEVDKNLQEVQKEITAVNKELAELKSKKQILRSQVSELRNPRLLAQLSAFEESRQKNREEIVRLENDLKNKASNIDQIINPEKEKIQEILKQHQKEEVEFGKEIMVLNKSIIEKEKDLVQKEKESKEFYSKYHQLFSRREQAGQHISKAENEIEQVREKSRDAEREINLISLKNAEIKAKLAALEDEFAKYKDVPLLENKNVQELQNEINRFEVMLTQMSAVNMKALEVYELVEKEFSALRDKRENLIREKTDVLTLMNEIETKKKEHFMKTFNLANENFQRIFTTLFSKGKAYLHLDNPEQPFEDGLSIKVKLTGNRFMDIKSLSGGEKTLTALSFIFAIQEYQPASFYILDEIDAALDKHNSETLSKLIRNYATNAQYIMISHNDSIISEADTLYGISMNDGVSKVTSLKI